MNLQFDSQTDEANDAVPHSMRNGRLQSPWIVFGILLLALSARLIAAEVMYRKPDRLPDSMLYLAYAEKMYRGEGFRVGNDAARRPPGYPAYLVLCNTLLPGDTLTEDRDRRRETVERVALWGQALLGTLICLLTYLLAKRFEPDRLPSGAARFALLLAAFDPYSMIVGALALSETLFAFLMIAAIYLASRPAKRKSISAHLFVGVLIGAAILVRPSGLYLPVLWFLLLWIASKQKRRLIERAAICLIGFVLVSAPWWYRNYQQFHKFVPTTLNVGESLYDGLNPKADGGSDTSFADDPVVKKLGEVERDRWWWDQAMKFAKENPRRVLELANIKLGRFWSPWPNERNFRSPMVLVLSALATIPVWLMALVGLIRLRQQGTLLLVALLPTLYFCLLHMIFVSSVRYRVPGMPLFYLLAGAGIAITLRSLFARRTP